MWRPTWLRSRRHDRKPTGFNPASLVAGSFLLMILLGAAVLQSDWATREHLSWHQALFTATSAVTVTGLSVIDVQQSLTLPGQLVLLLLIQLGGIGIMTFAALMMLLLGHQLGIGEQRVVREAMNHTRVMDLGWLVKRIFLLVLTIELFGVFLLMNIMVPVDGWIQGVYQSIFYSVSAFNNAGFALTSEGMAGQAGHWPLALVLGSLSIVGGLGFTVLSEIRLSASWKTLSLHSRLMLSGTATLLLLGFLVFALCEWNNPDTLAPYSADEKLAISFFHSVVPRSSGFNMIDVGGMTMAATMFCIILMFIGAGTNSTGGGIKVTTFMTLVLATRAFLRGRSEPVVFGRTIGQELVLKALAMVFIAMMIVMLSLFALTITDPEQEFLDLFFETVSACATVGLSRGITSDLSDAGQQVLMVAMFIGRIGPLTLVFLLARPQLQRIRYPSGDVHIG